MEIIRLEKNCKEWQEFLKKNDALIFHTPYWKEFIEKTFPKIKTEYLTVVENNEIKLIFPFSIVKHILFGKRMVSCGFIEYGGPAGELKIDYLKNIISEISEKYSKTLDYLEIREGLYEINDFKLLGLVKSCDYIRPVIELGNSEEIWKGLDKKRRNNIRKAIKNGIIIKELKRVNLQRVYDMYLENMKRFGTPPLPLNFFENFWDIFIENKLARITGAYYQNKLIAAMLGYTYKNSIHITADASDIRYWVYKPNDMIYWEFIEWGCKNNYKLFDFGRTRVDSGQLKFKEQMGAKLKDLNYYYLFWKTKEIPYLDPTNPKYKIFIKIWQNLPTFVSKRIGLWLREGLGI